MKEKKLFIKNMVCNRCIMVVENILKRNNIGFVKILLGEVSLLKEISKEERTRLTADLAIVGFELIDDKKRVLIEKVKTTVLQFINGLPENAGIKLSFFISENLKHEYTYISDLFSSIEGYTIENYFIGQRIEKVKELMVYDQLSLSEIAFQLGYSNVHHLSSQFKKVTGLTPTHFKKIGVHKRKAMGER